MLMLLNLDSNKTKTMLPQLYQTCHQQSKDPHCNRHHAPKTKTRKKEKVTD